MIRGSSAPYLACTPCVPLFVHCLISLVAPYRAILRYYRCDTPYRAILFKGGEHSPKMVRYPPWYLILHRHIRAIPHFATYRAIIVRYPIKTSTKQFCDTIATSIARYEKYRCWASKLIRVEAKRVFRLPGAGGVISIVRWNLRPVIFGVEMGVISVGSLSFCPA